MNKPDNFTQEEWDAYLKVSGYVHLTTPPTIIQSQSAQSSQPFVQFPTLRFPKIDIGWIVVGAMTLGIGYLYITSNNTPSNGDITLWQKLGMLSSKVVTLSGNTVENTVDFINPAGEMVEAPRKGDVIAGFTVTADMDGVRDYGKHAAIDLGTPSGTQIYMPYDGTIKPIEDANCGYGAFITFKQAPGYALVLCHLQRPPLNGTVKAQEIIAISGSTGRGSGPHLHAQLRRFKNTNNPSDFDAVVPSKDILRRLLQGVF